MENGIWKSSLRIGLNIKYVDVWFGNSHIRCIMIMELLGLWTYINEEKIINLVNPLSSFRVLVFIWKNDAVYKSFIVVLQINNP